MGDVMFRRSPLGTVTIGQGIVGLYYVRFNKGSRRSIRWFWSVKQAARTYSKWSRIIGAIECDE